MYINIGEAKLTGDTTGRSFKSNSRKQQKFTPETNPPLFSLQFSKSNAFTKTKLAFNNHATAKTH